MIFVFLAPGFDGLTSLAVNSAEVDDEVGVKRIKPLMRPRNLNLIRNRLIASLRWGQRRAENDESVVNARRKKKPNNTNLLWETI